MISCAPIEERLADVKKDLHYAAIENFYEQERTNRSNVLKMNHIDEGMTMLAAWGLPYDTILAYAIHPIVQTAETVPEAINEEKTFIVKNGVDNPKSITLPVSNILTLAEEYRRLANAYLCRPKTDHIRTPEDLKAILGQITHDCAFMLLADKIQNQKDFRIYHWRTHHRSIELERYFNLWIETLSKNYLGLAA